MKFHYYKLLIKWLQNLADFNTKTANLFKMIVWFTQKIIKKCNFELFYIKSHKKDWYGNTLAKCIITQSVWLLQEFFSISSIKDSSEKTSI